MQVSPVGLQIYLLSFSACLNSLTSVFRDTEPRSCGGYTQVVPQWRHYRLKALLSAYFCLPWVVNQECVIAVCYVWAGRWLVCSFQVLSVRNPWLFCEPQLCLLWASYRSGAVCPYDACYEIAPSITVRVCYWYPATPRPSFCVIQACFTCTPGISGHALRALPGRLAGVRPWSTKASSNAPTLMALTHSWWSFTTSPDTFSFRRCSASIASTQSKTFSLPLPRWIFIAISANGSAAKAREYMPSCGLIPFLFADARGKPEAETIAASRIFNTFSCVHFESFSFWLKSSWLLFCSRSHAANNSSSWTLVGFRCRTLPFCRERTDSWCCSSCRSACSLSAPWDARCRLFPAVWSNHF